MGMELNPAVPASSPLSTPSILMVGAPSVGKRTILNRLISDGRSSSTPSSAGVTCHGWTIDTKYYTANLSVWLAHLDQQEVEAEVRTGSLSEHCEALVMVFDLSNVESFAALQQWFSGVISKNFEIILCVGNKADCVPDHFAHVEYRRRLQRLGESSSDPHPDFVDFGIERSEGAGLLYEETKPSEDRRHLYNEWCIDHGVEYIETCAANEAFDACVSVDGDLQGVARIHGALSAHMWPGLVLKPAGDRGAHLPISAKDSSESSNDSGSEYEIEYELLSNASAEDWHGENLVTSDECQVSMEANADNNELSRNATSNGSASHDASLGAASSASIVQNSEIIEVYEESGQVGSADPERSTLQSETARNFEDLEQLMQEMAGMRENMRLMPDGQRREMAARIAMRMASLFHDSENEDD